VWLRRQDGTAPPRLLESTLGPDGRPVMANAEEVWEIIDRVQWDRQASLAAMLRYHVPWLALDWAATEAEDAACIAKTPEERKQLLRHKFRLKIGDLVRGEDGPMHARRDNLRHDHSKTSHMASNCGPVIGWKGGES
jgi:hypothetical protein